MVYQALETPAVELYAGHLENFRLDYVPWEEVVGVAVEAQAARAAAVCDVGPRTKTPGELMAIMPDYMQ